MKKAKITFELEVKDNFQKGECWRCILTCPDRTIGESRTCKLEIEKVSNE